MKSGLSKLVLYVGSMLCLSACSTLASVTPTPMPIEQLIAIVKASNPDAPSNTSESADFGFATSELARWGPAAAPAAPVLAQALQYRRRDSYMAAYALVEIGSAASPAVPELIIALGNDSPSVRECSAFVLGIIGKPSTRAVPALARLLWDPDKFARTAAAAAIDSITGISLLSSERQELDPANPCSVMADEPEGSIVGKARAWWLEEGQYSNWGE
jgi:hypothetical protein